MSNNVGTILLRRSDGSVSFHSDERIWIESYRPRTRFGDPGLRVVMQPSSSMYFAIGLGMSKAADIKASVTVLF